MTNDEELRAFSIRLNDVCDEREIPPKGKSRQLAVAKLFEVSQNAARKWLEGEGYPSTAMGKRIARWGGVTFDWLMTGEGPRTLLEQFAPHPLVARYEAADAATRAMIDLALAAPDEAPPENLSPSLKAMIEMARVAFREELKPR